MPGFIIYIIIQIALAAFAIYVVFNREQIGAKHVHKKDSRWEKIAIVILIPAMGFGYSLLGRYPPKSDQLEFTTFFTVFMYVIVILRWRRQSRVSETQPPPAPVERRYYYRSNDGTPCGPDTEDRLSVLARMGFITEDTPIADESSPDAWKPLRNRPELELLHKAQVD
jgi:hypothetical protein